MLAKRILRPMGARSDLRQQSIIRPQLSEFLRITNGLTFWALLDRGTYPKFSAAGTTGLSTETVDADGTIPSFWETGLVKGATANTARITSNGVLSEVASTNRALYSRDFSNEAWAKTNVAVDNTANTMPDGTSRTTNELRATDANGTVIQDLGVIASAAGTWSIYVKRKTGTGSIYLTRNGGSDWTEITVTSAWARQTLTTTVADPDIGIKIETSGDEIIVDLVQDEAQAAATSTIPTTSAAVVRSADVLAYPTASHIDATSCTLIFSMRLNSALAGTIIDCRNGAFNKDGFALLASGSNLRWYCRTDAGVQADFTGSATISKDTNYVVGLVCANDDFRMYVDGAADGTPDTSGTMNAQGASLFLGKQVDGATANNMLLKHLLIYNRSLSAGEILTATVDIKRMMGITS